MSHAKQGKCNILFSDSCTQEWRTAKEKIIFILYEFTSGLDYKWDSFLPDNFPYLQPCNATEASCLTKRWTHKTYNWQMLCLQ
jgi:hypothetical protein